MTRRSAHKHFARDSRLGQGVTLACVAAMLCLWAGCGTSNESSTNDSTGGEGSSGSGEGSLLSSGASGGRTSGASGRAASGESGGSGSSGAKSGASGKAQSGAKDAGTVSGKAQSGARDGGAGGDSGSERPNPAGCSRPAGMAAVTLTYDDALPTHTKTVAPALKAHGLKATFFLKDVRASEPRWAALLEDGHELAFHTFDHPCPKVNTWVEPGNANEDYDLARMATELDEGVDMLKALGQSPPFTFAYPCGIDWVGDAHESYVPLLQERFIAARGVSPGPVKEGGNLWKVPAAFFEPTADGAELISMAESAKAKGNWVVYGFHGIGGDYNINEATAHEELLTYLDEHRSEIYVATFAELAACFSP